MQAIMNTRFKLLKNQKGLTLVELLAVIVILGVIAGIATPAIGSLVIKSKVNADIQTELLLQDAAVRYLTATDATTGTSVAVGTLVSAGYLKEAPKKQSAAGTPAYATIAVTYDATKGWTATVDAPATPATPAT